MNTIKTTRDTRQLPTYKHVASTVLEDNGRWRRVHRDDEALGVLVTRWLEFALLDDDGWTLANSTAVDAVIERDFPATCTHGVSSVHESTAVVFVDYAH